MNEVGADELSEFARRVLGDRGAAEEAVATVVGAKRAHGLDEIVALAQVCRELPDSFVPAEERPFGMSEGGSLAASVAVELDGANAALTRRQREILALRELLGLTYDEISAVIGLELEAVCALLARGRLQFRAKLRSVSSDADEEECPDRDQALQLLARGLDREPVPEDDVNWLFAHIAGCEGCQCAHSEMHEASVVYRAWVWR